MTIRTFSVGVFSFLIGMGIAAPIGFAQSAPVMQSLSVSPSSASSGILRSLSWSATDSFGTDLLFTCPPGVTITLDNGVSASCGTRVSLSSAGSGSVGLSLLNVTGTEKQIYVRAYPKDSSGTVNDSGSLSATLSVSPVQGALSDLTLSTTTLASGGTLSFTWESHYVPGVNVRFECSGLQITLPESTTLIPCGSMAFASDLSANGTQSVVVTNPQNTSASLTLVMLPSIVAGSYDGLNAKTVSVTILGKTAPSDPSADSFSASSLSPVSSATTTLSWSARNAAGANVQYSCTDDITAYDAQGMWVRCGIPVFTTATTSSSTALRFVNGGALPRVVRLSLLAQRTDGSYVVASNRDLSLVVLPPGMRTQTSPAASGVQTAPLVPQTAAAQKHAPITVSLYKGMRHAQVTILQTFLSLDGTVYPEKSVSGYFGPATEAAVKRFQKRYGIAREGSAGFGLVGPATRAKINALSTP
jgi:hypothetical protein